MSEIMILGGMALFGAAFMGCAILTRPRHTLEVLRHNPQRSDPL